MRKKYSLISVFALLILLMAASCDSRKAFDFNQKLVAVDDSLGKRMEAFSAKMNDVNTYKDFASLSGERKALEAYVDGKITEIKAMKDVNGSEQFHQEMIGYLQSARDLISQGFGPLEALNEQSTEEEANRMIANMQQLQARLEAQTKKLQQAQSEYARKNNFKIES